MSVARPCSVYRVSAETFDLLKENFKPTVWKWLMSDQENSDSNAKEQELAKQLSTYADGLIAFSFVQGATFGFLVAQNAAVACELRSQWVVAEVCLAIAGAGYFLLLHFCKRGEDKLLNPAVRGGKIMRCMVFAF
jgi:hypothetical protein